MRRILERFLPRKFGGPGRERLPVYYFHRVPNIGDQLTPWLIRRFGFEPVLTKPRSGPHLLAIGSVLQLANRNSHVWGSGLIDGDSGGGGLLARNVYAVRGKLTYRRLCEQGLKLADVPFGDPAFLVPRFLAVPTQGAKTYRAGIAAHYVDRDAPWVRDVLRNPDFVDLDVHLPVEEFVARLTSCEAVISSSLHGLVLAEAFSISNVWIELSAGVRGAGFKFRDWFSLAGHPQTQPMLPHADIASILSRAALHEFVIDCDALAAAFPGKVLAH